MTGKARTVQPLLATRTLPDQSYQPPKAEREEEHNMPEASTKTMRPAFFRPFSVKRETAD